MRGLARWLAQDFLGAQSAAVVRGQRGETLASWFRWVIARKRTWGFLMMLGAYAIAAGFDAYNCPDPATTEAGRVALCETIAKLSGWLQGTAGILIAIGFVDKDWRNPKQGAPDILKGLLAHAAIVGSVAYAAAELLAQSASPWAVEAHRVLTGIVIPTLAVGGFLQVPARALPPRGQALAAAASFPSSSRDVTPGAPPPMCVCGKRMRTVGHNTARCPRCGNVRSYLPGRGWV